MRDRDFLRRVYINAEDGFAITAAANWRAHQRVKLGMEIQYLDHERPLRRFADVAPTIDELSARFNVRFFF